MERPDICSECGQHANEHGAIPHQFVPPAAAQRTSLTHQQKLEAMAAKYYSLMPWVPKAGDYYTSSRADLELYRVVKIENGTVYTEYTTSPGNLAEWPESEFTTAGFGLSRVWVPAWVLR